MKNIRVIMAVLMCVCMSACGSEKKIDQFIEENIGIYKGVDEYITVDDLMGTYENYKGEYGTFLIGNIGEIRCYGNISYINNDNKYVDRIRFTFKDSAGNDDKEFAKKVQEKCKTLYTNGMYEEDINSKYIVGVAADVYVAMNFEESNKCRAELAGVSVEEYKKEIRSSLEGTYSKLQIDDNKDWLLQIAKKEIKKQLISPNSAKFPMQDSFKIEHLGDNDYVVTVDVTSKNAYGVEIQNTFSIWINGTGSSNYTIVDIAY